MPVDARRFIRKMRGGAQAHLIQASNGKHYVVKFRNNPQHRRILINEFIASVFLNYLQISAPETAVIAVDEAFLAANPDVYISQGSGRVPIEPGWHFGSGYPGDPAKVAVYDFIPDALLHQIANHLEFRGMLAFDKWMANADSRQAVFVRARLRTYVPSSAEHPLRVGFVALMMDHGFIFNGPHWDLPESPLQGLYFRPSVYSAVRGFADFEPWLERIRHFPDEVVDRAVSGIPRAWFEDDESQLHALLEKLRKRRQRVPDLIRDSIRGRVNPFPNWR